MGHFLTWAFAGATLLLSLITQASAAVVYVNQAAGGATHDGASWGTAFLTIQEAVTGAKAGDEVWVARGTYVESITAPTVVELYGGFAGTETDRSQRDLRNNVTSLAWSGQEAAISCTGPRAVISDFRIRSAGTAVSGAHCALTVAGNVISDSANGVYLSESDGILTRNIITRCSFGVRSTDSSPHLVGNTLSANQTGVFADQTSTSSDFTVTLSGNTITGNIAGAVLSSKITLVNNLIAFNGNVGFRALFAKSVYLSHNNVYGNGLPDYDGVLNPTGQNGNISLDPKLSSIYHDIHLEPDSPCRDAGDSDAPGALLDIDGQPRLQGNSVDIGSDESDGTVSTVPSRVWLVSTTGNDTNAGASWATAKRTIAAGTAVAQGGDEVWVAKGLYTGTVSVPAGVALYGGFAGTETDRAQRSIAANPSIIEGPDPASSTVVACAYLSTRVDGFTVRGGASGIVTTAGATLTNNQVTANSTGILVSIGGSTLAGNAITANSGDGVRLEAATVQMVENTVASNAGSGVNATTESSLTMSRNTVANNAGGGVVVEDFSRATLRDNVVTGNSAVAVAVRNGGTAWLVNNTLAISGLGGWGVNVENAVASLSNNIIAYHAGPGVRLAGATSMLTMVHNDVFGNNVDYDGMPDSVHQTDIHINPLFASYDNRDFHLAGPTVVDLGDDTEVLPEDRDRDGRDRLLGLHVDLGAYEYQTPGDATAADVVRALQIAGGLSPATLEDLARLNASGSETPRITLADAARLARKAAGLDPNP